MQGKQIYMQLGQSGDEPKKEPEPEFKSEFQTPEALNFRKKIDEILKDKYEDMAVDSAIDNLLGGVEILEISGGMATIAMPLSMLKMLSKFGELLNHNKGISR